ncbi:phospho-2-dehydro-3-deoxyheptonate aldolase [Longispora fulva]|nr:3-deoxy-7-phosphoheptulonate synthase [Longispora fulva]GIG59281.1 phospho-2-dehydro-3-deoxyheptonate aldolase [Longispora fulva]
MNSGRLAPVGDPTGCCSLRVAVAATRPAAQLPGWRDATRVRGVRAALRGSPPLVASGEVDLLSARLAAVARGAAFVLLGGDCAETFAGNTDAHLRGNLDLLARMAAELGRRSGLPTVGVARMAGQFAKPRSAATDADGLPVYRGDMVNGLAAEPAAREADPDRMLRAYRASSTAIDFLRASGHGRVFTAHEALVLDYEQALLRREPSAGWAPYSGSAHFLWIGERTRDLDGAHIAFAELVANPVGVKLGPHTTPEEAVEYVRRLDPHRVPGRLTLISRMGSRRVRDVLPAIIEKVSASGHAVVWQCDPMHGNTVTSATGHKTRYVDQVKDELTGYFEVHRGLGTFPGGVHLEMTGDDVTECVGGGVAESDLGARYETACDPRLNPAQAWEIATLVADLIPTGY